MGDGWCVVGWLAVHYSTQYMYGTIPWRPGPCAAGFGFGLVWSGLVWSGESGNMSTTWDDPWTDRPLGGTSRLFWVKFGRFDMTADGKKRKEKRRKKTKRSEDWHMKLKKKKKRSIAGRGEGKCRTWRCSMHNVCNMYMYDAQCTMQGEFSNLFNFILFYVGTKLGRWNVKCEVVWCEYSNRVCIWMHLLNWIELNWTLIGKIN